MKEYTDKRNWIGGGLYCSKSDRSVFVPSRLMPLSFCPNLGRPLASLSLTAFFLTALVLTWLYAPQISPSLVDPKVRGGVIAAELALFWIFCRSLWKKD
jgi:hypothetical protein